MVATNPLAPHYPLVALRGVGALGLGLGVLAVPGLGQGGLLAALCVYAALAALPTLTAFAGKRGGRPTSLATVAAAGLLLGGVALSGRDPDVLRLVAAGWAFVNGGAGLALAFRLKRDEGGQLLAAGAVLSLFLALALIPPGVAETLHLVLAAYGLLGGLLLLALSLRLRRLTVPRS